MENTRKNKEQDHLVTMENKESQTYEKPKTLTVKNVIYWSEHYKKLKGVNKGGAIQTKARIFLRKGLIEYDPKGEKYAERIHGDYEGHKFICRPIEGYNKTTYRMKWDKVYGGFNCTCQFFTTTGFQCSHMTALWMKIKIWNWNRIKNE